MQALRYRCVHKHTRVVSQVTRVWPVLVLMSRFLNTAPQHHCFLHRSWLSQEAIGFENGTWWQLLIMWGAHRQAGLCVCAHARAHICLFGAFSSADVPPQQADRRPPATLRHVAHCWLGCSKAAEHKIKARCGKIPAHEWWLVLGILVQIPPILPHVGCAST